MRIPIRRAVNLIIMGGILLSLAACGSLPSPEPTAIPLAARATSVPQPTRPALPTPTVVLPTPSPSPTPPPASNLPQLDDLLVGRLVEDFLNRLAAGDAAAAFQLDLTEQAQQRYDTQLGQPNLQIVEARLLGLRRRAVDRYEAQALLYWTPPEGSSTGTHTANMDLVIVPDRGLWRIETITLGDLVAATPTPTRRPSSGAARPVPQLTGRLVFQVSSGGDIYTINADGSNLQRLTDGLDPAWSPSAPEGKAGETQIAFSRWRAPWGIYLIRPDGSGQEERVVDGNLFKEVAWSPDGSRLAFSINYSFGGGGEICFFGYCFTIPPMSVGQIWTANLDNGDLLNLPLDDKASHSPAWDPAPGENRIVYAGDRGLAWIELDGMAKGRFASSSAWDNSPSFSPDGQRIAFMGRVHNHWEIFVMNADGSGRTHLTHGDVDLDPPPSNVAPAWSPDGKQIAFLSNRDGPWRIYVMNADGSGQRSLFGDQLDHLGIRYEWASERVVSWTQ